MVTLSCKLVARKEGLNAKDTDTWLPVFPVRTHLGAACPGDAGHLPEMQVGVLGPAEKARGEG